MADSSTSVAEQVPETSSRWITESITGAFDFEVNKSQVKGTVIGEFITSRDFRVGGYEWRIKFYPKGVNKDCAGSTSTYVQCCASPVMDVRIKFTLSVLEGDGPAPVASYEAVQQEVEQVFSLERDEWGYHQFVAKSYLKPLLRQAGDGCFTIRCVLAVINESPPLELLGHLERMLHDGIGADITFGVGGQEFRAHRSLLSARSPVFHAQFFGPMCDKEKPHSQVIDVDATIFKMVLHYIYTDSMPPCSDGEGDRNATVFQHLLVAADMYGLERLKTMCEQELCKRMDVETVMASFTLANRHSCKRLKDACLVFMSSSPEVLGVVLENVHFKDT